MTDNNRHGLPRLVSREEICKAIGISPTTLWRLCRSGEFPQPIRLSRIRIAWHEQDVQAWLDARAGKAGCG